MTMRFANEKRSKVLIAAHRGAAGGNIPCNSFLAFKTALRDGADIIELDVSRSNDGKLYVFHPGMEPVFLKSKTLISDMPASEVDEMVLVNQDTMRTQYHVPHFYEALEMLRGKVYINIDKFWTCPEEIAKIVRELGMQDQVLIKTDAGEEHFRRVEEVAADLPYMVITRDTDDFSENLLKRKMRYVGVEALFAKDDAPIAQPEYLENMRKNGLIAWANSIVFNYKAVLASDHTDDISVSGNEAHGWGWLVDSGFGIIQTDWALHLKLYLEKIGRR